MAEPLVDKGVLSRLPAQVAKDLKVFPLREEAQAVVVAARKGHDPGLAADLVFMLGKNVMLEIWSDEELLPAIQEHYGGMAAPSDCPGALKVDEQPRAGHDLNANAFKLGSGSVVTLVNDLISNAIRMGASDIHVEPYERYMRVRFRLDGVLHEVERPPLEEAKAIISRLKIMADLDIAEKRRPQDGRIRVKEGERIIDIRVSSLPTDFGEKIVLRILDKSQLQLDLTKLGFEERDLKQFQRTLRLPYGMILVTGPTGSGKTTTLYAALNSINRPEINITTIEDPIEYNLPGINQTHVRSDIGLTFAAALRSILRQDPNVIMLGEIRDGETAQIAIRAALTGHLVLSTLHTNDAISAITRLSDMGVEPFLVAASVKMILAQRLLRRLCQHCRISSKLAHEQLDVLHCSPSHRFQAVYAPQGCDACNHLGYKGRTAVYEILAIENALAERISRGASGAELRAEGERCGMRTLRDAALEKASRGETSLDEVVRETVV